MSNTTPLSTRNRIGLAIAGLFGLIDCSAFVWLQLPGGEPDPLLDILVSTVLGAATAVAVIVGWRTARAWALRLAAGTRVLSAVTALPAFFVDVPPALKLYVAVFVVLTLVATVLLLTPAPRAATTGG